MLKYNDDYEAYVLESVRIIYDSFYAVAAVSV